MNQKDKPGIIQNPQSEIIATLRQILDRFYWVLLILGVIAVSASILRIFQHGWNNLYTFHLAFLAFMLFIFLFRRLLPVWAITILIGMSIAIIAIMNLITFGLASIGLLTLFVVIAITNIFFSIRATLITLIISIVIIILIGAGISTHYLPMKFNANRYIMSSTAWITQITIFLTMISALVISTQSLKSRLMKALLKEQQQSKQLAQTNFQLKKNEEQYRLLAENMSDVVFIQDMELNIVYVSPSVRKLFGYTVEETLQLKMNQLLTPDSLQQAIKTFQHYSNLATNEEITIPLMQYQYIHKNGTLFWGELRVRFLYDNNGELKGSQGILRDITERKKSEDEKNILRDKLTHAEKMEAVGMLAGGIAHDFNNQLAGIMGWTEILKHDNPNNNNISECTNNILSIVQRTADLTNKLLAFARRGNYHNIPIDVHSLIGEVISILKHTIDKTITIKQNLAAIPSTVKGDPTQIQNALLNIAINASDAMPNGGDITFSSTVVELTEDSFPPHHAEIAPGQFIEVCITDTGTGIDKEVAHRMFEPFFTTKEPGKGTGLGLASVYGTIQAHQGGIDASSTPGSGTTFKLYLPVYSEEAHTPENINSTDAPLNGKGNLLLIEDEETVRNTVINILSRHGFIITTCSDGQEAVNEYETIWESVDLIILDVVLPKVGGKDVFNEIRKVNPKAKVLFYSGYSPDKQLQELLEQENTGFIQKPFTLHDLFQSVNKLLMQ